MKKVLGISLALAAVAAATAFLLKKKHVERLAGSTGKLALDWGGLPGVPENLGWSIRSTEMR